MSPVSTGTIHRSELYSLKLSVGSITSRSDGLKNNMLLLIFIGAKIKRARYETIWMRVWVMMLARISKV